MNKKFNGKSIKLIILIIAFIITSLGTITAAQVFYNKSDTEAVASVNGDPISKDELYQLMVKNSGQDALDSLIAEKVVKLEIEKQNITISQEDIQAKVQELIDQNGGQDSFDQLLESYGYTMDDIKANVQAYLEKVKLLEPSITITEEEMKTYFEENKDTFTSEDATQEPTYEENAEKIKDTLFEEKLSTAYDTWLQDKYTEYKIENYLNIQ